MTVTLTGKIVAIIAIVAILILGLAFRKYKKLTDSILKAQDRQIKSLEKTIESDHVLIQAWTDITDDLKKQAQEVEDFKKAKETSE